MIKILHLHHKDTRISSFYGGGGGDGYGKGRDKDDLEQVIQC